MNIIKAIEAINDKLDFLIKKIEGEENMIDITTLEASLEKATDLIVKSKATITDLQNTVKDREATIASHVAALKNNADVENSVSTISTKFSDKFKDFEGFLNSVVNNVPVANTTVVTPVVETATVIQTATETITLNPTPFDPRVHPSAPEEVTRIGPLQQ